MFITELFSKASDTPHLKETIAKAFSETREIVDVLKEFSWYLPEYLDKAEKEPNWRKQLTMLKAVEDCIDMNIDDHVPDDLASGESAYTYYQKWRSLRKSHFLACCPDQEVVIRMSVKSFSCLFS